MCAFEWFEDAHVIAWIDSTFAVTTSDLAHWLIDRLGDGDICLMPHLVGNRVF
jgi:hypothetical protein